MLTEKQVEEIREHLEKAQSPIFFYDNDQDGLCSFALLARFIEKGKGVIIRSYPDMDESYFRKVLELKADYIFILDRPRVSDEFWNETEKYNIPCVWIDHHDVQSTVPNFVNYYNVFLNKPPTHEPVTALCYQISQKKEDLWIALIGCIADKFMPDFYKNFKKEFPELSLGGRNLDAFDIFFKSEIGKLARMLGFGLKDTTTNVVRLQKLLLDAKSPYDFLKENKRNENFFKSFDRNFSQYTRLLERAKKNFNGKDKILFFQYAGETSLSSDLANELSYLYPGKYIVIFRIAGMNVNLSMRGENVKGIISKAIENLNDSKGGGHKNAVGGQIKFDDLELFKSNVEKIITNGK